MSEPFIRMTAGVPTASRIGRIVQAIVLLLVGSLLSVQQWGTTFAPFGFALSAVGAVLIASAALRDDIETWVRPEELSVRHRNLFRTRVQTIPVADVKGIGVSADRFVNVGPPLLWRVMIDTARHGRIRAADALSEKDAIALEMRVRRTLGW